MKFFKNSKYWFSSGYLFFFFVAWAVWWAFYAIWLSRTLNLNGVQTGLVYSINSAVSLVFMFAFGVIEDKLGTRKNLLWVQSILLMGTGPFLIYVYEPLLQSMFLLGTILGAVYLGAAFLSGVGFLEAYVEKISRKYNFEYGTSRMWGSLGYAVGAFVAGISLSINPHLNFWLASGFGCVFFLLNIFYKVDVTEKEKKETSELNLKTVFNTLRLKKFWLLIIFLFGTSCIYGIYDQQLFPVFFTHHFTDPDTGYQVYGYLNSFQVFLESAMMFAAPFIINKLGAKRSLTLAGLIMCTRILGSAMVDNVIGISLIKLLHGFETPILIVAIFKYIALNFDSRLSATIYLIGFQVSGQIGVIAFSSLIGSLYDHSGYNMTFLVIGLVVLAFTVYSIFSLTGGKARKKQRLDAVRTGQS
ncbi:MFS transporter [Sporolactobacillus sp. THM19-2]|uniref:MFS transporter n=1 Tax=Sporolactobacillus sp. THM19-2 TaxID=2511171 RepID=UPI00101FDC8C|nr:MFS transporter [Sporolactobacillus sp. THM19-2]RYL88885.1 MFS transporter [Sporolactobacillus sp. THM19-2]